MKKLILLSLILFSISHSFAQEEKLSEKEKARREKNIQAGNPFKRFGYTPKIATLSKGKYLEFHDLDSIVRIGSFSYHVKRKALVGYTKLDTVHPESTLRPEIISRWFSPDPLSDEFPSWSPYNFTNNNPIFFVDPTGLAPQSVLDDYGIDKKGNIKLIKKTKDNFDRLFVAKSDEKGNAILDKNGLAQKAGNKNVKINKKGILSALSINIKDVDLGYYGKGVLSMSYANNSDKNDIFRLFKFASDNSNSEWSVTKLQFEGGTKLYNISTYHNESLSPGGSETGIVTTTLGDTHSHPGFSRKEEVGSLIGHQITSRKIVTPFYIYFPNSKNVYKQWYKKDSPTQTKKVKSFRF